MAYHARETATQTGQPIHLYQFNIGSAEWCYTSADTDVEAAGKTWIALAASNNNIRITGEAKQDALRIRMRSDTAPGVLFVGTPPSPEIAVRIRRLHLDDDDAAVVYVGTVSQVDFPEPGEVAITCSTLSLLQRNGLRLTWSRICPHMLYDHRCRANPGTYRIAATLADAGGGVVRAPEFALWPENWLAGGYLEWTAAAGYTERRGIEWNTSDTVALLGFSDGLSAGMVVTAYPGCDRTLATCSAKFSNSENHGGFPHLAGRSPFDGNPVF